MKYIAVAVCLFSRLCALEVSVAQQLSRDEITRSDKYYFGTAIAPTEKEASDRALADLINSIAVRVTSEFVNIKAETNGEVTENVQSIMKSYSGVTLRNVGSARTKVNDGVECIYYIQKEEISKIFGDRKSLVCNLYDNAREFELQGNVGEALKYYYFGIILLNSIPESVIEHQGKNLFLEIPLRINALLSSVKLTVRRDKKLSETEREIQLSVQAGNLPVSTLDFSFWDGTSRVNVHAVDGIGVFRLFGSSVAFDRIEVNLKYSYDESRDELKEVMEVWDYVPRPVFKNSMMVDCNPGNSVVSPAHPATVTVTQKEKTAIAARIGPEVTKFIRLLRGGNQAAMRKAYADDAFLSNKIGQLMQYNHPVPVDDTVDITLNKTYSGWEVRKVRVMTNYGSLRKTSTESLILDFNDQGKLTDVNFGTVENLYEHFVEQGRYGNDWGNRQVIIKFVERYRTAFLCRNMEMLDVLFADEAIIIVGRSLKKTPSKDTYHYSQLTAAQPDVRTIQYSKEQYLKNVRANFTRQADITLAFSTFKILRKNNQPGVYGISMRQQYASTSYADEGHLFLLVDFLQGEPQIYIRSWQPQEWGDDAIVNLASFKLNR